MAATFGLDAASERYGYFRTLVAVHDKGNYIGHSVQASDFAPRQCDGLAGELGPRNVPDRI